MLHDDTSVLTDNLKRLALSPSEYRFFGKSSGAVLIQAAMELKQEYAQSGEPVPKASQKPGFSASRTEFWAPQNVCWPLHLLVRESPPYLYYLSGSWDQIYSYNHLNTFFPMMTLPWVLSTSTSLTSTYTYPFSTGLVSRSPSQRVCIMMTTDSHLSTSLYALLVLAIRTIREFCWMGLSRFTLVVGDGSTRSKWWKNRSYVRRPCMISNFIVCVFFFCPGTAVVVTDFIAFCAFFARIVCTAVMLDHGRIWNTFGSGCRGSSTESPTWSDGRGWAVEKGILVCHSYPILSNFKQYS